MGSLRRYRHARYRRFLRAASKAPTNDDRSVALRLVSCTTCRFVATRVGLACVEGWLLGATCRSDTRHELSPPYTLNCGCGQRNSRALHCRKFGGLVWRTRRGSLRGGELRDERTAWCRYRYMFTAPGFSVGSRRHVLSRQTRLSKRIFGVSMAATERPFWRSAHSSRDPARRELRSGVWARTAPPNVAQER